MLLVAAGEPFPRFSDQSGHLPQKSTEEGDPCNAPSFLFMCQTFMCQIECYKKKGCEQVCKYRRESNIPQRALRSAPLSLAAKEIPMRIKGMYEFPLSHVVSPSKFMFHHYLTMKLQIRHSENVYAFTALFNSGASRNFIS